MVSSPTEDGAAAAKSCHEGVLPPLPPKPLAAADTAPALPGGCWAVTVCPLCSWLAQSHPGRVKDTACVQVGRSEGWPQQPPGES